MKQIVLAVRQQQVLELMAKGKSEKEIAAELNLSYKTIKHYKTLLYIDLKAVNAAHAIAIGYQSGLLKMPNTSVIRLAPLPRRPIQSTGRLAWVR